MISRRLVCMQVVDADPVSSECRSELIRYLQHAWLALGNATRLEAIPGGRLLASLAPAIESRRQWLLETDRDQRGGDDVFGLRCLLSGTAGRLLERFDSASRHSNVGIASRRRRPADPCATRPGRVFAARNC